MKVTELAQESPSLLNILTRSDTDKSRPGLEITASINRLATKSLILHF